MANFSSRVSNPGEKGRTPFTEVKYTDKIQKSPLKAVLDTKN